MKTSTFFTTVCVMVICCVLVSATSAKSQAKGSKLLSRIRRQIWGGSYNMIFARQQCDDKPCWLDDECCRGYSCFNPESRSIRLIRERNLGVCLDNVDIMKLEEEILG